MSGKEMTSLLDAREATHLAIHRLLKIAGRGKSVEAVFDEELKLYAAIDQAAARLESEINNTEV